MTSSPPTTPLQACFTVMHPIYHLFHPLKILIVRIPTILLSKQEVVKCDKSQIQSCCSSLHKRSVITPISRSGNHNLRVIPIAALPVADWTQTYHLFVTSADFFEDSQIIKRKCSDKQKQKSFSFQKS